MGLHACRCIVVLGAMMGVLLSASGASGADPRAELKRKGIAFDAASLIEQAGKGDQAVVRLFLDAGMDVDAANADGETALMAASEQGHVDVARLLLERGADTGRATIRTRRTAIFTAASGGHAAVIRLLAAHGADVNARDNTNSRPLHVAALWGHAAAVQALLELGANPGFRDGLSNTPLMVAEQNGHAQVVKLLRAKAGD